MQHHYFLLIKTTSITEYNIRMLSSVVDVVYLSKKTRAIVLQKPYLCLTVRVRISRRAETRPISTCRPIQALYNLAEIDFATRTAVPG